MTKKEIYEKVVQLTAELHATNVAEKIFSAAQEGESKKVEEVFENFKKENHDLYSRIVDLGKKFNKFIFKGNTLKKFLKLFGSKNDKEKEAYVYDSNNINAVDLYALTLLGEIDDYYLFDWETESSKNFVKAIEEAGYIKLANFLSCWTVYDYIGKGEKYQNVYQCLVGIFKGEIE